MPVSASVAFTSAAFTSQSNRDNKDGPELCPQRCCLTGFQHAKGGSTDEKQAGPYCHRRAMTACASTAPTKIGADTYYAAKTNTAGIFGDVSAVAGDLMIQGNQFCGGMGREFQLVTQSTTSNIPGVRFGGASITFKCVIQASSPVMRPDNGVSTVITK